MRGFGVVAERQADYPDGSREDQLSKTDAKYLALLFPRPISDSICYGLLSLTVKRIKMVEHSPQGLAQGTSVP